VPTRLYSWPRFRDLIREELPVTRVSSRLLRISLLPPESYYRVKPRASRHGFKSRVVLVTELLMDELRRRR
jgi:hypothetical protein